MCTRLCAHTPTSFVLNNARPCTFTIISVLKASYLSGRISAGCGTGGQARVECGGGESGRRHMYYSSERDLRHHSILRTCDKGRRGEPMGPVWGMHQQGEKKRRWREKESDRVSQEGNKTHMERLCKWCHNKKRGVKKPVIAHEQSQINTHWNKCQKKENKPTGRWLKRKPSRANGRLYLCNLASRVLILNGN